MKILLQLLLPILLFSITLPAQSPTRTWQTSDIIDQRIDVHAQRSLMRMLKGNAIQQKAANDLLLAVKAGYLEGIYLVDQGVPAKRVRSYGGNWWETVPKGELFALVTEPATRPPLIALPKNILADHGKTDQALVGGWLKMILMEPDEATASKKYSLVATHTAVLKERKQSYTSVKSLNSAGGYLYTPDQLANELQALATKMKWTSDQLKWFTLYNMNYAIEVSRDVGDEATLKAYEAAIVTVGGKDALIKCVRQHVERPLDQQTAFRREILRKIDSLFAEGKTARVNMPPIYDELLPNGGLIDGDPVFNDQKVVGKLAKDAKGTTCIEFQRNLLFHHAAAVGRTDFRLVKSSTSPSIHSRPSFFTSKGPQRAAAVKAWRQGKKNMAQTYRPKPGDIYLLNYPKNPALILPEKHRDRPGYRSHTGYIKSIRVISPEKEIWTTVDGGQSVSGLQAVLEVKRIYNPMTNMLFADHSGTQGKKNTSQDQYIRFVIGWIDVDHLIE